MAKLTYSQRKKMPKSDFAVVEKRKSKRGKGTVEEKRFPINDKAHARNALSRLSQAKGLSAEDKKAIKNKADKKLYGTTSKSEIVKVKKSRSKRS